MTINKGISHSDGTYDYVCGTCNGRGYLAANPGSDVCPDCFGLNADAILIAMKAGVKGQRYYTLLKAYLSVKGKAIIDAAKKIKAERSKFAYIDIVIIHLEFGLNFKATCEWLSECGVIPSGIYERMIWQTKVKDLVEKAKEEIEKRKEENK